MQHGLWLKLFCLRLHEPQGREWWNMKRIRTELLCPSDMCSEIAKQPASSRYHSHTIAACRRGKLSKRVDLMLLHEHTQSNARHITLTATPGQRAGLF